MEIKRRCLWGERERVEERDIPKCWKKVEEFHWQTYFTQNHNNCTLWRFYGKTLMTPQRTKPTRNLLWPSHTTQEQARKKERKREPQLGLRNRYFSLHTFFVSKCKWPFLHINLLVRISTWITTLSPYV